MHKASPSAGCDHRRKGLFSLTSAHRALCLHAASAWGGVSFSNSHKGARRTRHPAGGAGEERGRGGPIPALEARATMATVDTARSTAMTARAQRRDLMYMGSPAGGEGTTRRHRLGDGPNSGPC